MFRSRMPFLPNQDPRIRACRGLGAIVAVLVWMRLFPDLVRIKSVAPEGPAS